jgi:hypothetical protein
MVERTTTVYRRPRPASALPTCSATRARWSVERLPLRADGVPTQTIARSVPAIASAGSVVARRRPSRTTSSISSPMRSSRTGVRPAATMATFSGFTSTPTTSWPRAAKQAAETAPT